MERRKAVATAGAVTAMGIAAVIALGANLGLFGLTGHESGPGHFKLVDSKPTPQITQVVDGSDVPPSSATASVPRGDHERPGEERTTAGHGSDEDD
jgi:hypothetical protein